MTGFSREFLQSLDGATAVAYRGEPGNAELAQLLWPMSETERREFAASVARIAGELRDADDETVERILAERDAAAGRAEAGDDLRVHTWEPADPPVRPWAGEV